MKLTKKIIEQIDKLHQEEVPSDCTARCSLFIDSVLHKDIEVISLKDNRNTIEIIKKKQFKFKQKEGTYKFVFVVDQYDKRPIVNKDFKQLLNTNTFMLEGYITDNIMLGTLLDNKSYSSTLIVRVCSLPTYAFPC